MVNIDLKWGLGLAICGVLVLYAVNKCEVFRSSPRLVDAVNDVAASLVTSGLQLIVVQSRG